MRKFVIIPIIALLFAACGSNSDTTISEELDNSWAQMSSKEQSTFCLGYHLVDEDEFRAQAAERFSEADADEAVSWAKETCD